MMVNSLQIEAFRSIFTVSTTLNMTDNDGNDHAAPKQGTTHIDFSGDLGKIHDGDAALALFDNLDEIHEGFEPGEEKRIVRKIDLMILPFLSVCYAFYYVSHGSLNSISGN